MTDSSLRKALRNLKGSLGCLDSSQLDELHEQVLEEISSRAYPFNSPGQKIRVFDGKMYAIAPNNTVFKLNEKAQTWYPFPSTEHLPGALVSSNFVVTSGDLVITPESPGINLADYLRKTVITSLSTYTSTGLSQTVPSGKWLVEAELWIPAASREGVMRLYCGGRQLEVDCSPGKITTARFSVDTRDSENSEAVVDFRMGSLL